VFENKILRRIFVIYIISANITFGGKIKDKMGRTSRHGEDEKCIQNSSFSV
jgi:hypothetical protein